MKIPETPLPLSEEIDALRQAGDAEGFTVGKLLEISRGRGYFIALMILSLPFCSPIPTPGLSIPFGVMVCLLGLRLAAGRKSWLPERYLNRPIPKETTAKVLHLLTRLLRRLEKWAGPCLPLLTQTRIFRVFNGVLICLAGFMMMLPIPIPLSNGLPAMAVFLTSWGSIQRNGWLVLMGYGLAVIALSFCILLALAGKEVIRYIPWIAPPAAN